MSPSHVLPPEDEAIYSPRVSPDSYVVNVDVRDVKGVSYYCQQQSVENWWYIVEVGNIIVLTGYNDNGFRNACELIKHLWEHRMPDDLKHLYKVEMQDELMIGFYRCHT